MRLILKGGEFGLTSDSGTKTNTRDSVKCQFQMYNKYNSC